MQQRQQRVSKSPTHRAVSMHFVVPNRFIQQAQENVGLHLKESSDYSNILSLYKAEGNLLDHGTIFHHLHSTCLMQQYSDHAHHSHHQPMPQFAHMLLKESFEVNTTLFLLSPCTLKCIAISLVGLFFMSVSNLFCNYTPPVAINGNGKSRFTKV